MKTKNEEDKDNMLHFAFQWRVRQGGPALGSGGLLELAVEGEVDEEVEVLQEAAAQLCLFANTTRALVDRIVRRTKNEEEHLDGLEALEKFDGGVAHGL
jgi:hypothetical protein